LKIYCDNFATVFFPRNEKYFKGAKIMKLKYFVVEKEVHRENEAYIDERKEI